MDNTKLAKTWLMLREELECIIKNKEYFLFDKILEKYQIKEEDFIWGISRSYKMDFYYKVFELYCLQENYPKAIEMLEYFNAYDGGYLYRDVLFDDKIRLDGITEKNITSNRMTIRIITQKENITTEMQEIPFETKKVETDELIKGSEKIVQKGEAGEVQVTLKAPRSE